MADSRYWIGDSGNWGDTAHWSESSGGPGGASIPTQISPVLFDVNSFSVIDRMVLISDSNFKCLSIDCTGSIEFNLDLNSRSLSVYGDIILASGTHILSQTTTDYLYMKANGSLVPNGSDTEFSLYIQGSGVVCELLGEIDGGYFSAIVGNGASFNTNNNNVNCNLIQVLSGGSLNLGSSIIRASMDIHTDAAFNAGTSTIYIEGYLTSYGGWLYGGNHNFYNINVEYNGHNTLTGNNTIRSLSVSGGFTRLLINGAQIVTNTASFVGANAYTRPLVRSAIKGTNMTITCNGSLTISNVDFQYITGAGTASWLGGTRIGDCGGNINIEVEPASDKYWVGNGGNWSNTHWALSSGGAVDVNNYPLPQDYAIFDSNSFTLDNQTVVINVPRIPGFETTGVTHPPIIDTSLGFFRRFDCLGDVTVPTGSMSFSTVSDIMILDASRVGTISFDVDIQWDFEIEIHSNPDGIVRLLKDLIAPSGQIELTGGVFDTNNFDTSSKFFWSSSSNYRTLILGSGTHTVTGSASVVTWNIGGSNITVDAGTSTIKIPIEDASNRMFFGMYFEYYNLEVSGLGTGELRIYQSNTFNRITIKDQTKTVKFEPGTTQTIIDTIIANGTPSDHIILEGIGPGNWNLVKSIGTVRVTYCTIVYSQASGGANWRASNSIDGGNNTGWIFDLSGVFVLDGGDWKVANNCWILIGSAWESITRVVLAIGETWKDVFTR